MLVVHLPKTKKEFMQTGNTDFIYKMSLIRLVFNMIWLMVNRKNFNKKFFDKKPCGSRIANETNYQLANELHKPITQANKIL